MDIPAVGSLAQGMHVSQIYDYLNVAAFGGTTALVVEQSEVSRRDWTQGRGLTGHDRSIGDGLPKSTPFTIVWTNYLSRLGEND